MKNITIAILILSLTACGHASGGGGTNDNGNGNANQLCQDICGFDLTCNIITQDGYDACISSCVGEIIQQLGTDELPSTIFDCQDACTGTAACGQLNACVLGCGS